MEMGGNDSGHMPKSYSLNMFQDFVPMCVLSETGQGNYLGSITCYEVLRRFNDDFCCS